MKSPLLATVFLAAALNLHAAEPAATSPGSLAVLAGLEPVERELGLSASQSRRIQSLREAYRADAREIVASAVDPSASRKEAGNALANARAKTDAAVLAVLTPSQQKRLREIELQKLEGTMLTSPAVQTALGLSPEQTKRIADIQDSHLRRADRITADFEAGRIDQWQRLDRLRDSRLRASAAQLSVLNPKQRNQLETMKGVPLPGI